MIIDFDVFFEELVMICECGFVFNCEEIVLKFYVVGVVVIDNEGCFVGVISILGFLNWFWGD